MIKADFSPGLARNSCGSVQQVWSKRKLTRPHFNCVIFEYFEIIICDGRAKTDPLSGKLEIPRCCLWTCVCQLLKVEVCAIEKKKTKSRKLTCQLLCNPALVRNQWQRRLSSCLLSANLAWQLRAHFSRRNAGMTHGRTQSVT